VTVELAEVAAGLPVAASFALAGGFGSVRESRRRGALNEAMHELRRPLQALSLALPDDTAPDGAVDSSLRLAVAALERLDREINGDRTEPDLTRVPVRQLLEEAARRWSDQARSRGRAIRLRWSSEDQWVEGDPVELAQAVDNLISNALEHGGGTVSIEARREGAWLLIGVCDRGGERRGRGRGRGGHSSAGPGRHGHGLRVVARVARTHRGSFRLRRSPRGTEARLRLPLLLAEEER
jgi:signal transduction histidine kinase